MTLPATNLRRNLIASMGTKGLPITAWPGQRIRGGGMALPILPIQDVSVLLLVFRAERR